MSHDKRGPVCLGYVSGMKYYLLIWVWFHKPWHEDPVIKQPVFHGSSTRPFKIMAQNVFFWLTGVVKCIKSGQIIVISQWPGPPKGSYEREVGPLISGSSRFPWKPPKNHPFSCAAGKFCCQDLVKFLLRKYASPQAFTPEGAERCEFFFSVATKGHPLWRTHLTGHRTFFRWWCLGDHLTPPFLMRFAMFFLGGHKKGSLEGLITTRITIAAIWDDPNQGSWILMLETLETDLEASESAPSPLRLGDNKIDPLGTQGGRNGASKDHLQLLHSSNQRSHGWQWKISIFSSFEHLHSTQF